MKSRYIKIKNSKQKKAGIHMKNVTFLRKKERANKGITLIALVITIIVLLILAAISIVTLTGENGILRQSNKS